MPQVYQQPTQGMLNRAHPLVNQLIFAWSSAGYTYGYADATNVAGIDSVYGTSGVFSAVPLIPNKRYTTAGNMMNPGAGPIRLTWQDPLAQGSSGPAGQTVACLIASDVAWVAAEQYVWGRRNSLTGANGGIALGNKNGGVNPGWLSECSDGVTQNQIDTGGGVSYQSQDQYYLLVGVLNPDGTHSIYVDGALIAATASGMTFPIVTGAKTFQFLNDTANTQQFDGSGSAGFFWNRALTPQEIGMLYADPFILWKFPNAEEDDGLGLPFQTALNSTFFLCF